MEKIFEIATRGKLRFTTTQGNITTEDLWDLPMEKLDTMYLILTKEIKDSQGESLLNKTTKINNELSLKTDIIKHIVQTKLEEKEIKTNEVARKAQIRDIQDLIARKQNAAMEEKPLEELLKMLEDLK